MLTPWICEISLGLEVLVYVKQYTFIFKGHLLCKIHFYMVFGHKCVLAVCEHNHPTMIKIHPLLIF